MLVIGNTWNIIILYTFWIYIYECNILYKYFSLIIKSMNILIKVLKIINQNFSKNADPSTFPPIITIQYLTNLQIFQKTLPFSGCLSKPTNLYFLSFIA
jgi:hypothetical protein